jgi:hypothetical protein
MRALLIQIKRLIGTLEEAQILKDRLQISLELKLAMAISFKKVSPLPEVMGSE